MCLFDVSNDLSLEVAVQVVVILEVALQVVVALMSVAGGPRAFA